MFIFSSPKFSLVYLLIILDLYLQTLVVTAPTTGKATTSISSNSTSNSSTTTTTPTTKTPSSTPFSSTLDPNTFTKTKIFPGNFSIFHTSPSTTEKSFSGFYLVGVLVVMTITFVFFLGAVFYTFFFMMVPKEEGVQSNQVYGSRIEGQGFFKNVMYKSNKVGKSRKLKGKLKRSLLGKSQKMSPGQRSTLKSKTLGGHKTLHTGKFSRLTRATCKILSHTTSDSERLAKMKKLQSMMKVKSSEVQKLSTNLPSLLRQSSSSKIQVSSEVLPEGQGQKVIKKLPATSTQKPSSSTSAFVVTCSKQSAQKCSGFRQTAQPRRERKSKSNKPNKNTLTRRSKK